MLKNLTRRARAAGCDPQIVEPDYLELFKRFFVQNVDAENWQRKAENVRHYERGRADMEAAYKFGAALASFRQFPSTTPLPWPPVEVHAVGPSPDAFAAQEATSDRTAEKAETLAEGGPQLGVAAPPAAINFQYETAAAALLDGPAAEELPTAVAPLTFSQALAEFLQQDAENKGNADARGDIQLVVQFLIDQMDDPIEATDYDPFVVAEEMGRAMRRWFAPAFADDGKPLPAGPEFQHLLCGLVMLADWLGSTEEIFSFVPDFDPDYWPKGAS